jgi:hypothetical protein
MSNERRNNLTRNSPTYTTQHKIMCTCWNIWRERDQGSCVITKAGDIDVVHIIPFSMRNHQHFDTLSQFNIWQTLCLFWSHNRVKARYDAIFDKGDFVDVCHKLMCLNPLAHRYHGNGYFALKPIDRSAAPRFTYKCWDDRGRAARHISDRPAPEKGVNSLGCMRCLQQMFGDRFIEHLNHKILC